MNLQLKKKIAFIISRKNYLKFLASFIYENLDQNDVYIFCDQRTSKDNFKWRDLPDIEIFKRFNNVKVISFINNDNLNDSLLLNKIEEVYSLQPMNYFNLKKKNKNLKWIICQHGIDLFYYLDDLDKCDEIYFYTEYFLEKFKSLILDKKEKYKNVKLYCVGNKQLGLVEHISKNEVLEKYDLPNNREIIIFFPLGQPNLYLYKNFFSKFFLKIFYIIPDTQSILYKLIFKFQFLVSFFFTNELSVLRAISNYAKKKNKFFIVKSRSKRVFGKEIFKFIDRAIYDEEYYPSTILNLLKVSSESFSYYSTISSEVAAVGTCKHTSIFHNSFIFNDLNENFYNKYLEKDYFEMEPLMTLVERKKFLKLLSRDANYNYKDLEKVKKNYHKKYIG